MILDDLLSLLKYYWPEMDVKLQIKPAFIYDQTAEHTKYYQIEQTQKSEVVLQRPLGAAMFTIYKIRAKNILTIFLTITISVVVMNNGTFILRVMLEDHEEFLPLKA